MPFHELENKEIKNKEKGEENIHEWEYLILENIRQILNLGWIFFSTMIHKWFSFKFENFRNTYA